MSKHYKFTVPTRLILLISILTISGIIYSVIARSSGMTGKTSQTSDGCSCHGGSPNSNTTVSATSGSGSFIVDPNSSNSFTISVSNSSMSGAGVNIAIATTETGNTMAGTLSAPQGSGLQLTSNELTHSSRKSMTSGTASFTFNWTAPSQHGTYYLRAIGNAVNSNGRNDGDEWNWMTPQQITVKGITLASPNGGQEWCLGSNQTITWNHTALQNVRIDLSTNGGVSFDINITQSTPAQSGSYSWNIPTNLPPGNQYRVRVSDASNNSNGDASDANFIIGGAPTITSHPQSQSGCTRQNVSFVVNATGAGLTYQWRKNGTNINGATQASYTINNLTTDHAGTYDCVLSGACGSPVTSNSAQLTVDLTPTILTHPESKEVCKGTSVSFTVEATGTDITYQWRKSGVDIQNATSNTIVISNVREADEGLYTCVVSGKCSPAAVSNPASLSIKTPPVITKEPTNAQLCIGEKLELNVTATGNDLTYQWRKNGNPINNANSNVFTIPSVSAQDSGIYDVIVRGSCSPSDTSIQVKVTIDQAPIITEQPKEQTVNEGSNVTFNVKVSNTARSYQWRKSGVDIPNANQPSYTLTNVKQNDEGNYDCLVTNKCGTTTSNRVKLTIIPKGDGPLLSLSQNSIEFGTVKINSKLEKTFPGLLKNIGSETLTITEINIIGDNPSDYEIFGVTLPMNLSVDEEKQLNIRFTPSEIGIRSAIIKFKGNFAQPPELQLSGIGGFIKISAQEKIIDFGNVGINNSSTKNALIINEGNAPAKLSQFTIAGEDITEFGFPLDIAEITLDAESEVELPLVFNPSSEGSKTAIFTITVDENEKISIQLIGNATTSLKDDYPFINHFSAFPNPAENRITFQFNSIIEGNFQIAIYNSLGIAIYHSTQFFKFGDNFFEWHLLDDSGNRSSSGTYYLHITNGVYSFVYKVVLY